MNDIHRRQLNCSTARFGDTDGSLAEVGAEAVVADAPSSVTEQNADEWLRILPVAADTEPLEDYHAAIGMVAEVLYQVKIVAPLQVRSQRTDRSPADSPVDMD